MKPLTLANWNVLADVYTFGLFPKTTEPSNKQIKQLNFKHRSHSFQEIFHTLAINEIVDLFCLQEVDHFYDFYKPTFDEIHFTSLYLQRPTREDGCLIAFNPKKLTLYDTQEVYLDDLMKSRPAYGQGSGGKQYERFNVALMAKFACVDDPTKMFVVSCVHLYWNPAKPKVKLAQTRYILHALANYRNGLPAILTGDFNAIPTTDQYNEITTGIISKVMTTRNDDLNEEWNENNKPQFLCDASLSKICRWLRLLGFNAALESSQQLHERSIAKNFSSFFTQATQEKRIIITSSRTMVERSLCPEAYCIETKDLMSSLVDICLYYNIPITEKQLLTVCGKCGGYIIALKDTSYAPEKTVWPGDRDRIPNNVPVLICEQCSQLYWLVSLRISMTIYLFLMIMLLFSSFNINLCSYAQFCVSLKVE